MEEINNIKEPELNIEPLKEAPKVEPMEINWDAIKLPEDGTIPIKHVMDTIVIGKPSKTDFFMVKSGEGYTPETFPLYSPTKGKDGNVYVVTSPEAQKLLLDKGELIPARCYLIILYGSGIFKLDYISLKADRKDGSRNRFHTTRQRIYEEVANKQWVQMRANTEGNFYEHSLPEDTLDAPNWKDAPKTLRKALNIAFKGLVIDSIDHPEIKKIRGKL